VHEVIWQLLNQVTPMAMPQLVLAYLCHLQTIMSTAEDVVYVAQNSGPDSDSSGEER
jgi:hypothetical protein